MRLKPCNPRRFHRNRLGLQGSSALLLTIAELNAFGARNGGELFSTESKTINANFTATYIICTRRLS